MRLQTTMSSSKPTVFIQILNRLFRFAGHIAADYAITTIVVSSVITAILSAKILFTPIKDDVQKGYSMKNARSIKEFDYYRVFNNGLDPILVFALITAKDDGSMARLSHLNETVSVIDFVGDHFAIKNLTYNNICNNFCQANEAVRQFRNGLILNSESRFGGSIINVSFPMMQFLGRELDLTPSFFGVEKYEPNEIGPTNGSNIKDLKVIVLQFRAQRPIDWNDDDKIAWERRVGEYYRKNVTDEYNSSNLKVMVFTMSFTQDEIVRTGLTLAPYISLGFSIMCLFSITTVFMYTKYTKQWSMLKIVYALLGCICPLFAVSAALGFLFWIGFRFGSILCVVPFLVLAIGVDDAFLIINAWNRNIQQQHCLGEKKKIRNIITEVLLDVGPSITITSLTNMLAFGIGASLSIPEIQLLCIAIATAIFFDYVYTLTMYAAILCVGARFELNNERIEIPSGKSSASQLLQKYCEWLSSGFTSILMLLILSLYLFVSMKGALSAKAGLTPEKLFLSDSPMIEMNMIRDKYVLPAYAFVTVFVNNPGNLADTSRIGRVKQMIEAFEAMPECNGKEFSHFWIRDYETYLNAERLDEDSFKNGTAYSPADLENFFEWPEFAHWGGFVKFNDEGEVRSFFITVAYHGENQADWIQKLYMLKKWRAIVDNFTDLEASIYNDEAFFTEQFEILIPTMIQTSGVVLLSMAIICWLFMSNIWAVFVAISSIMSICIGVFGFTTFWNIDVDPVSMSTMIMSIGLAVDFPAHIAFHYYRTGLSNEHKSAQERIAHSLATIGFPLLQCSGSTVLFVLCLLLVPCYMSEVFIKSIALVISLGTVHALIIIPALLCTLTTIHNRLFANKDNESDTSQKTTVSRLADSPIVRRIRSETGNKIKPATVNIQ